MKTRCRRLPWHPILGVVVFVWAASAASLSLAQSSARAQRPMHIHKIAELGLEIWTENQPPWNARIARGKSLPVFVAESPELYYPPAVMTYVSMPGKPVAADVFRTLAMTVIREAAQNHAAQDARAAASQAVQARYGVLEGIEATFSGTANGEEVDVKVFVGQAQGGFPVAMQAYTLRGRLTHLSEPIRRAWTNVKYLK